MVLHAYPENVKPPTPSIVFAVVCAGDHMPEPVKSFSENALCCSIIIPVHASLFLLTGCQLITGDENEMKIKPIFTRT